MCVLAEAPWLLVPKMSRHTGVPALAHPLSTGLAVAIPTLKCFGVAKNPEIEGYEAPRPAQRVSRNSEHLGVTRSEEEKRD